MPEPAPKKLFHIATFGCRTNQADTAALRDEFFQSSFQETDDSSLADVVVVNSCTVTHRSDQQVRQLVRRFRRLNPKAKLVVTGCYAQRSPRELASIPGVTAVVGNTHKGRLVQLTELVGVNPAGFVELAPVYRDSFDGSRALEPSSPARPGERVDELAPSSRSRTAAMPAAPTASFPRCEVTYPHNRVHSLC